MKSRLKCGPVLIAEDDARSRSLLEDLLQGAGYETISAGTGEEALDLAHARAPAAAVLDVNLAGLSGYEVCHELRRLHGPGVAIMLVSGDRIESFDRVAGLLLGADDYLTKPFDPSELLARLEGVIRRVRPAPERRNLTAREFQVLTLLADGLEQSEIAERLMISPKTVATHIERILAKLGVRSRAQAVAVAYRETLVAVSA